MKFFETWRNYRNIRNKIWSVDMAIKELIELNGFPKHGYDGMPKASSSSGDSKIINFLQKLDELNDVKAKLDTTLQCMRNDITRFLDNIEDFRMRQVVEIKVFDSKNLSWDEVADKIEPHYSSSYIRKLYKQGLRFLEEIEL